VTASPATCPTCHQHIHHTRLGVQLTPLKCEIFDAIKRAGELGVSSEELRQDLYADRRPVREVTIKAHIWQLNDALEDTGWRITSDRRRWFLTRPKKGGRR
jgi:hypothetical protein